MTNKEEKLLEMLLMDFTVSVRDPLWNNILLTKETAAILEDRDFQKLSRIKQLGPTSIVYPGAVHTRISHSLGVYDISRRIMISLLQQGCKNISPEGLSSFLIAALLHDLGHFPYAHSLKEIISRSHESLACDIILNSSNLKKRIKDAGAETEAVCLIIFPECNVKTSLNEKEIEFYQNVLSGALDPDKLDYLCRDAFFCGVPYGTMDVSYVTDHIGACNNRLALRKSDSSCIEHLLFSKYLMYRNVYWLSSVRSATAMVKCAVYNGLTDGIIKEEDLFNLDDYEFTALCSKKNYTPFGLIEDVKNGKLYQCVHEFDCPTELTLENAREIKLQAIKKFGNAAIVDIPEKISFETNIDLIDNDGNITEFKNGKGPFNNMHVAKAFTSSLRKIRVFCP